MCIAKWIIYYEAKKESFQVEIEDKTKAKYNGNIAYWKDYIKSVKNDLKDEVSTLAIMRGDILITQTDDERGSVKAVNPKVYPEPLVGPAVSNKACIVSQ